jgi:hypothetical protein
VELNLRKHYASQKPTSFRPVRTVIARALEKNYLLLFRLERDRLAPPAVLETAAEPAAGFPEADKFNGRVPFSEMIHNKFKGALWEPRL